MTLHELRWLGTSQNLYEIFKHLYIEKAGAPSQSLPLIFTFFHICPYPYYTLSCIFVYENSRNIVFIWILCVLQGWGLFTRKAWRVMGRKVKGEPSKWSGISHCWKFLPGNVRAQRTIYNHIVVSGIRREIHSHARFLKDVVGLNNKCSPSKKINPITFPSFRERRLKILKGYFVAKVTLTSWALLKLDNIAGTLFREFFRQSFNSA